MEQSSQQRVASASRVAFGFPATVGILHIEAARAVAVLPTGCLPTIETSTAFFGAAFQVQSHLQPENSICVMAASEVSLPWQPDLIVHCIGKSAVPSHQRLQSPRRLIGALARRYSMQS